MSENLRGISLTHTVHYTSDFVKLVDISGVTTTLVVFTNCELLEIIGAGFLTDWMPFLLPT